MLILSPTHQKELVSTADVSALTGFAKSTVRSWLRPDRPHPFPAPRREGRHFRWSKAEVLQWMQEEGLTPVIDDLDAIGYPETPVDSNDKLLSTKDLTAYLGIQRSWLYERLKTGWLPEPDIAPGPPHPNYWFQSTVDQWRKAAAN